MKVVFGSGFLAFCEKDSARRAFVSPWCTVRVVLLLFACVSGSLDSRNFWTIFCLFCSIPYEVAVQ